MAVVKLPQTCTAGIKVQKGLNAAGKPVYKNINFSTVKTSATDQDIYDVMNALGALQSYSVAELVRTDSAILQVQ